MTKTAKTVSPFEHDERTAPSHWGSALINDDYSGIEDEAEVARIKEFAADLAADGWSITGNGDYSEIQVFEGLQTECTAFEIMREKVPALVDGDTFTVTRQTDGRVAPTPVFTGSIDELKAALPALAAQDNKDAWIYLDRTRDGRTSSVSLPSYTVAGVGKAVEEIAPTPKLTMARVKAELAEIGITVTKTEDDELRVNLKGGKEATAYYAGTDENGNPDYADALATGKSMAATETRRLEIEQAEALAASPEMQPGYVDPEDRAYENEIEAWEENGIAAWEARAKAESKADADFYGDVTEPGERPTSTIDPRVARLQQIKAAEATKQPTEEQTRGRAR